MLPRTENVTLHHQCEFDKFNPSCILWLIWNDSRQNDIIALFDLPNVHHARGGVVRFESVLVFDDTTFNMLPRTENIALNHQCEFDKFNRNCILWLIWNDSRQNDIFTLFDQPKRAPYHWHHFHFGLPVSPIFKLLQWAENTILPPVLELSKDHLYRICDVQETKSRKIKDLKLS
jgi:hypothetical protein